MIFGRQDRKVFEESTHCHICKALLTPNDEENYNVRDHCHFTGKFRGAAHNNCNLNYRTPKFFPVIFHNLAGYDAHLFIKNLGKPEGEIDCIPNNEEKYISFTKKIVVGSFVDKEGKEVEVKRDLRFIDSFKFMASGLSKLVDNLSNFPTMEEFFPSEEKRRLLVRKGVYPYDHVNSLEKLQETRLPLKEAFYSKLIEEEISDEDYQHAQKVWNAFDMKTMREYHDLYLKSDVLLLADVFENFRKVCLENYELDPLWYYTAPGLAYDAMLKTTRVTLNLLTDIDMAMMIEKGIRGGVSMISTRYSEANNKYMGDQYDPSKPSRYIQYLDANNLYGWAMSQPLPTGDFKWMTPRQLDDWTTHPCILEVDLKYPQELHNLHDNYPLAPERVTVNKVEKLIPNLRDKEKYVIHHQALKQYLDLGLKLTKVHRGIKFREEPFMGKYIDLNTKLRQKAIAGGVVSGVCVALGKATMKKVEKHESVKRTAESSLNTVNDLVSNALRDRQVSNEESHHILREMENYRGHKANIKHSTRAALIELNADRERVIRAEAEKVGMERGKKETLTSLNNNTGTWAAEAATRE
ncbi:uncharacterized protein [Amphiura filiformis]|uniref:uncharacterized protein n=1 Tax=Amphiura filiformis TaxID=82378 RepID=UPI003B21D4A7